MEAGGVELWSAACFCNGTAVVQCTMRAHRMASRRMPNCKLMKGKATYLLQVTQAFEDGRIGPAKDHEGILGLRGLCTAGRVVL